MTALEKKYRSYVGRIVKSTNDWNKDVAYYVVQGIYRRSNAYRYELRPLGDKPNRYGGTTYVNSAAVVKGKGRYAKWEIVA